MFKLKCFFYSVPVVKYYLPIKIRHEAIDVSIGNIKYAKDAVPTPAN